MIPILYSPDELAFQTNGIGLLSDALDCTVTEELNGKFELEMKYPTTGAHFESIAQRSIILAKPDPVSDPQPFRVYRITKPINQITTVYARHIAYDLSGIVVPPFTVIGAAAAMQALSANGSPFTFWTDKSAGATLSVPIPTSIWGILGGSSGGILDTFGGEYEFDRLSIKLHARRGEGRGVVIRYGKNMTDFQQDENCSSCYTGVYPYWADQDGNLVQLPESTVMAEGDYGYTRILPLDLSDQWESAPTHDALRSRAMTYIRDNQIGVPSVSWTVKFVQLEQTEEYRRTALLERVLLGDTVSVIFAQMGVTASARAVSIQYKPLLERYDSVKLGRVKANIADSIANQQKQIDKKPDKSVVRFISKNLTNTMLGTNGGSVRLLDTDNDGLPDTLYIADNPDPAQANKVWRYNYEGWAGSENGYNGPFVLGATFEDGILADVITAAKLVSGTIQSADGSFLFDLDTGSVYLKSIQDALNGVEAALSTEVTQRTEQNGNILEQLSAVQQSASQVSILVQSVLDNGVDKVTTSMGYTFNDDGLHIQKSGEEMDNTLNHAGMYVKRGDETMLRADADGVLATDVMVQNYLVIGGHARFEDYSNGQDGSRTACFHI